MEKQKKVERWSYPFKAKGSNGGASSEITDPQVYYDALAKAGSGFYPVSSNGLWHGGVHFDQNTGAQLDQSSVRCIADGEVVAYRIDGKYKTLTYGEGASAHETIYSTGFVLVRHRLELPPAPAPATPAAGGTQPAATPPAAEPDLTFYSLYMHLMDWQGYQDKPELERPAFWAGDARTVKQSAPDKLQGLRVRATPNGTVLGVLPRGTLVEAEAAGPGINPNWLKFIRATPAVAGLAENTGYLHKGPADGSVLKALGEGRYIVNHKAKDPIEPAQKGANIRSAANGNSPILGLLPAGTQVRVSPTATTKSYHKLLAIIQGNATPAVSAEQLASEGYVWVKDLEAIKEPQARDSVFLVEPPVPIQAGALIGHLGKYQAATQGAPQDLLHLEVFTCDDMESFVTQSRARAKQLKPEQKTLLKIPSETKLITREDATQENPPQVSDPGQPTAYDMILPLAVLEALPAERKITLTTTTGGTTTTERWWKLENMPGKDGQPIGGWVKEDELITPRLHPWDWEGFDFIKETSTLSDQYACKLSTDGVLDDGEKTNYQAQINQGDSGPIKERLYDIIDTNHDEKLTPEEIRNAIGKPWHAQSISRLIVQYESEWYADPGLSKWEALNCYMTKEGEKDWAKEKERIKSLIWWTGSMVSNEQSDTGIASHLHPLGLLSHFSKVAKRSDLLVRRGQVTFDAEGNDIPGNLYFSRRLHWPGGASGVTLGRGYDMKQRTPTTVYADLIAAGVEPSAAQNFSQGAQLSGHAARDFVNNNRETYGVISRKAQRILFEDITYPRYETAAKTRYTNGTAGETNATPWESLNDRIRDIAVDLTYQQGSIWDRQLPHISSNDAEALAEYIRNTPELSQYEGGRQRARYLTGN
ncbi:hypothetical protein [Pseudomonas citronellolis]|uniref:hypothetical protein n=1 Tax=Pseudomonas citronellolis TaxID=53408 RepID=UPI002FDAA821